MSIKVKFVAANGEEFLVDGVDGATLMETARDNNVPGIDAECGGACSCATCQVYVDPAFSAVTGTASEIEEDMLDFAYEPSPQSRLSCQIQLNPSMNGLIVRLPERQS